MSVSEDITRFLTARQSSYADRRAFRKAREKLLTADKAEVLAEFEARLALPDDEERARAIEGLALLYRGEATDTIVRWIKDDSSTVRWVVCGCLQDFGDVRASAALLDRLLHDDECQVRGAAATALGSIGDVEQLPELYQTWQMDKEVDELGHTPSSLAEDAMTSILRSWVSKQLQGTPPGTFHESTSRGRITGKVNAEAISIDLTGSITDAKRYEHLPIAAFGMGWSSKLDLETSLAAPFEVGVEYVAPSCVIRRVFIYHPIPNADDVNWAVHTILHPELMTAPPHPD